MQGGEFVPVLRQPRLFQHPVVEGLKLRVGGVDKVVGALGAEPPRGPVPEVGVDARDIPRPPPDVGLIFLQPEQSGPIALGVFQGGAQKLLQPLCLNGGAAVHPDDPTAQGAAVPVQRDNVLPGGADDQPGHLSRPDGGLGETPAHGGAHRLPQTVGILLRPGGPLLDQGAVRAGAAHFVGGDVHKDGLHRRCPHVDRKNIAHVFAPLGSPPGGAGSKPYSNLCISSGRGTVKDNTCPVIGCRRVSRAEWRAGRGISARSSVP